MIFIKASLILFLFVRICYCNDKIFNNFLTEAKREENKLSYVDIILEEFKNEKDVSIWFKYPPQSISNQVQNDELLEAIRRIESKAQFTKIIKNTISVQEIKLFNANIFFLIKPQEFL